MNVLLKISAILFFIIPASTVNLPPDMSQGIFCESCTAVMKELDKLLAKKSSDPRELQVVEAMENICQAKYFSTYDYSPPTTIKACKFLIENYEEEIEQFLSKNSRDSEKGVCYKMTKACEGVDRTKKEKEDLNVKFNNQKVTMGGAQQQADDGIQRMNVDINDPGAAERLAEQIKQQMGQGGFGGGGRDDEADDDDDEVQGDGNDDDDEKGKESSKQKTEL
ncbi:PREDICTED: uncharacterized protein LOC107330939 [Acropora digitifera]|uniref:uncharacterized protein LOC107330939 n=1 Tax=Acropora digitifera TaxID=70779 RepID=UPI00077A6B59|nr:PREDICTED: uncharacterized protein LOC107330939 [Acropora digitifera]XP_015750964.1 PREDICTED: uncharacterized protein LOC107330939 [Acropora digitifera]